MAKLESENRSLIEAKEALNVELSRLREAQRAQESETREIQKKIVGELQENILLLQESLGSEDKSARA